MITTAAKAAATILLHEIFVKQIIAAIDSVRPFPVLINRACGEPEKDRERSCRHASNLGYHSLGDEAFDIYGVGRLAGPAGARRAGRG